MAFKLRNILTLVFALCLLCHEAVCSDKKDPGQLKLEKMQKLRGASSNGIIDFTPEMYK